MLSLPVYCPFQCEALADMSQHWLLGGDRRGSLQAEFSMDVFEHGPVEGFCGFFDVQFCGSKANPADYEVLLSTAPDPTGSTHWGQQSFVLHPTISCAPGKPSASANFWQIRANLSGIKKGGQQTHQRAALTLQCRMPAILPLYQCFLGAEG